MAPRLPLEVVEQIIDDVAAELPVFPGYHIHSSQLSSIRACALVCHSFLPVCRKHIFASVTLNVRSSPTSDDLNHLLSNSPHLAVYIRNLVYLVNKKEFAAKRLPWLLAMFKKFLRLQKLSISYSLDKVLDWMSSSVRKVLLPLLHLPTLTSIYLLRIGNFPLADLASCVNLKTLKIELLECSNDVGKFLETLPTTSAMLENLAIVEGNGRFVQQLCHTRRPDGKPIIDLSSLKEITAEVTRLDSMTKLFGMLRNLHKIKLSIGRVTTLDPLEPSSSWKGLFTMLKSSLPTLVGIHIEYYDEYDEDGDPLAGLCDELEKMVGRNVLGTIKLLVWVWPGYDYTGWGKLDDILMGSPEGWPALRKVSLAFNILDPSGDGSDTSKALREVSMTKLVESKRVQFDFQVREFPLGRPE